MKFIKGITIILAIALIVTFVCGCGSEKEPEKEKNDIIKEGKKVVENGTTFIDITAQYTSTAKTTVNEVKTPVIEKKPEPEISQAPITPKKRVRTFNEIFASFFGNFIPLKDDSNKDKIRKILTDVSIVTIVICLFGFGKLLIEYQSTVSGHDKISSKAVIADKLTDNEYVDLWKNRFSQGTTVKFPKRMNPAYAYPYSVNQDLVGWLKMDGLDLDIQVVQGADNLYYTDKDFYKKKNASGIPYLESKNNPAQLDDNTINAARDLGANYFQTLVANGSNDQSRSIRSYKTNALPFFKGFITAVEKTNPGYTWDWDEKKLIGKNVIAVFGEEDLMIATDIDNHTTFTTEAVNFTFNHILSRFNIAISTSIEDGTVTLKSLTVNGMNNKGSFDESLAAASTAGSTARWNNLAVDGTYAITAVKDASNNDVVVNASKQFIYQGLVIPQTAAYESINLDGTSDEAAPYLNIQYSITTGEGAAAKTQDYSYFYNLADLFNGEGSSNLAFNEGWQNNLYITIGAAAINFDAQVYEWATQTPGGNLEVQ